MLRTLFPNPANKKRDPGTLRTVLVVAGILLALGIAHWLVLQPAIAKVCIGPDCYEGTHYVTSGRYTEFEGGADFADVVRKSGILGLGEVTEFFYFDNRASDSPFHGKQPDVFALSVSMPSKAQYKEQKAALTQNAAGPMRTDTFAYYYISVIDLPGAVLAFQDATRTVRIVYVAGAQPFDPLLPIIGQNSPLFAYDEKEEN